MRTIVALGLLTQPRKERLAVRDLVQSPESVSRRMNEYLSRCNKDAQVSLLKMIFMMQGALV